MAIKFFNIRSGEQRTAETEPQIAALWSSSDRSPNISQGQDFGWRLAAETVVEVERIQSNPKEIEGIAIHFGLIPDSVGESDILAYISEREDRSTQGVDQTGDDFKQQYEEDIRKIRETGQDKSAASLKPKEVKEEPKEEPPEVPTETQVPAEGAPEPPTDESKTEEAKPDKVENPKGQEVSEEMSRAQLETLAKNLGIEAPSSFENKPKLVEAIKAKQSE